jgi:uncharacterized phage-associated protein
MGLNAVKDGMYPASLIAFAFVERGIKENKFVTQMKLQKVIYFAQGVHLAKFDEPLIQEEIQAWKFGPVVPEIYHQYKLYGNEPIRTTDWIAPVFERDKDLKNLSTNAKKSIEYTWDVTKDLSAITLSNWTHRKGSPWEKFYTDMHLGIVIDNEEIRSYFKKLLFNNTENG